MRPPLIPEPAICYSGFRQGQSPAHGVYPSYAEVREDLLILQRQWRYLRMYDVDPHAETVIEVIESEGLDMRLMLGAHIDAEIDNPDCPWGGVHDEAQLLRNRESNAGKIDRLIALANAHPRTVHSLSAGNEATVDWTDHSVPVPRVVEYVRRLRQFCAQPVTFCENYLPWLDKLTELAREVDFIAIHSYPVWEYRSIDEALQCTAQNYAAVAQRYPDKQVVITEAGWTTCSNGRGIDPGNAGEALQQRYCEELRAWCDEQRVMCFVFEAFDEPWKGSDDPAEPEKHWGLFTVERKPKQAMRSAYPELVE